MKNSILIIVLAFFCMGFYSCSLDEPSYGKTTTENFYGKESDINYALTGAYLQLRNTYNEFALNFYFIGDCTTDDALKGGSSDGDRREVLDLSYFTVYTTNAEVSRRWEILYRLINRCNEVIYYAPDAVGDKDMLTRYVNEAKALRAFGYYFLVSSFGDVPLLTEPKTPSEILTIPRSSADDVYKLIEEDLTAAMSLPAKGEYDENNAYRLTRGFAKVMLAKAYMFRGDFVNAEKYLKEVVEVDGDYSLLPDYGLNWTQSYENSSESVFELPNKMYDRNILTGTNVPHFFTSRRVAGYQGYGFHIPTKNLYDEFDADDPRITYVFTQTGDRYVGDTEDQDNGESITGFHDYKSTVPRIEKEGYDIWMIPYNIRLIRYSDVLLMYAEALNENGKSVQALKPLNAVRSRARATNPVDPRRTKQAYTLVVTANTLPDITTTDPAQLRQIIWKERRCELAMEGWRRDDLLRQKRFGEVMKAYAQKYDTSKGANFNDGRDYLLPIPQGEIDKSNNVLTQNPNY